MLGLALYLGVFKGRKPVVVENPGIWIDEEVAPEEEVLAGTWETDESYLYKITMKNSIYII